jgi:serine/threonine protein kinase
MTTTATTLAGRYRLREEIGRGGVGVVWEACDDLLQRDVAVKELRFPPGLSDEERDRLAERTLRDAQAVAVIDTPAAVRVFDVVEEDGRPWVVMEMVRGKSLTELIVERETLPPAESARIGLVVLDALECAHRAGLVHRDVKPSNVIVTDEGRIALGDFGIATVDADPDDGTGVIVGSPLYLAPELVAGGEATPASDLWALGATLWTAVEGAPPTVADSPPACSRCTPELGDLLARLMSHDPAARPGHDEIRAELEAVCRDARAASVRPPSTATAVAALPPSFARSRVIDTERPSRLAGATWPWVAAIVVALVVAAVVLSQMFGGGSEPSTATKAKDQPSAPSATLPDGWNRYDGSGWSIGTPDDWTAAASGDGVRIDDADSGLYVKVTPAYGSTDSAMSIAQAHEASYAGLYDFQEVGIEPASAANADDAADLEFTYSDQGVPLHAVERTLIVDGTAYSVWFQSHEDEWDGAGDTRDDVLATFRAH